MSDGSNSPAADATPAAGRRRRRDRASDSKRPQPNYAARRMLVGTAIITVAFIGAVVGWRALRDDPAGPTRASQQWDEFVFVDRLSGDVTWIDRDGAVAGRSSDNGRTGSVFATDGVVAVANSGVLTVLSGPDSEDPDADDDQESQDANSEAANDQDANSEAANDQDADSEAANDQDADGDDADSEEDREDGNFVVELPAQGTITLQPIDDRTLFVLGSSRGGDVLIVDPVERVVTDIGAAASSTLPSTPLMFVDTLRTNLDGSLFAIADATNFQTIAIRPDGDPPVFLPDQPVAVGDKLVATSQTVGLSADISLVALDRSTEANVPTEIPAGGEMVDDKLTVVSVDGKVFRIEAGSEEAESLGALALPSGESVRSAEPTADGSRLVASGTTFQAVIDLDGETIYSTVLPQAVEFTPSDPTWACLPVGGTGHWATIIDLTTGEHLADLADVEVVSIVDDGCTVLADRNGVTEVISPDGIVTIGAFDDVVLAPDGQAVITVTDGVTELVPIEDLELGQAIDLTEVAGTNSLIAFIPN